MGTKTLVRLLIALAILGGIAAILHFSGSGTSVSTVASSTDKKKVFSDFPINDVAKVMIKNKDSSVTLQKGEKSWEVAERAGYPAASEPIVSMLRDIWDLSIVQVITIGRSQYGRVNLIAPEDAATAEEGATIVTFQGKDGKDLASLWLGKVYERSENRANPMGGMAMTEAGRYVKKGTSNSVYLVGDTFDKVATDAAEWIDKDFFKVEGIKSIEIVSKEKKNDWKLVRDDAAGDFKFAKAGEDEKLDQAKVSSMKGAFANPQIEDVFVGEDAKKNKTGTTTFKIATFDGFNYEISVGEKNDLNELPLTLKVNGKFVEKRKKGEEESDEEAKKADEAFAANLKSLQDKLAAEKALEGHVFKVRSYLVDSIIKARADLLAEEEEEGADAAGGAQGGNPHGQLPGGVELPGGIKLP
ncbi:MAG: DUF4340 domain-containing protein [Verrucomicrobiales bacterium]|nr:DUF4340 domain-containing protein [Verrucomicrobiales bacterium]